MGQSVRASEAGLAIANQARQRRGWTKTSTARWWQDAHTSRATLRRFWRGERIQQEAFIAICQTVGLENWQDVAEDVAQEMADIVTVTEVEHPQIDWGEAPDIEQFFGRSQELVQLQNWVLTDRCKLVGIHGLGGSGKTALVLSFAEQVQAEFDGVIWRSLQTIQSLEDLVTSLLDEASESIDQGIRQLLKKMQGRWLIILDGLERDELDQQGPQSQLMNSYQGLIDRLSRARHQSCVVVTSRQPLPANLQQSNQVQSLTLTGLETDAAVQLLQSSNCVGQPRAFKALARLYGYNPLALKVVATTIQSVFGGEVSAFLAQDTIVLAREIRYLLKQQFDSLNPLEKDVLFWLAIWQEPISFCRLQTHLIDAPEPNQVIEALATLVQRSLSTRHFLSDEPAFSLQLMIMTFVIEEMVEAILQEIAQVQQSESIQDFQILRSHGLLRPGTDDVLCDRILSLLRPKLQKLFSDRGSSFVEHWTLEAKNFPPNRVGYLAFNLTALNL